MLRLNPKSKDGIYASYTWDTDLQYPIFVELIGFYHIFVNLSHGADLELKERFGYKLDPFVRRALYKLREQGK